MRRDDFAAAVGLPDMSDPISIRALTPSDAGVYRALRLEALASAPEAFSSSHEEESALPVESFRDRISPSGPSAIFGAFDGERLVGSVGFVANPRLKQRHKGMLVGLFVTPQWRRHGIGERLVRQAIAHAAAHVLLLQASVVMSNREARRLYHRLGFAAYGIERNALCIDGVFHDDELLVLELRKAQPPGA
jgi:ribosomal protein S18 acetylase RimI-like enzyme